MLGELILGVEEYEETIEVRVQDNLVKIRVDDVENTLLISLTTEEAYKLIEQLQSAIAVIN
jgi:hypothetical protein